MKLTSQNNPVIVFERHLRPLENGENKILLSRNNIDTEPGWPKWAAKLFLLNRPLRNENLRIEIKDTGRGKIHIIRKK